MAYGIPREDGFDPDKRIEVTEKDKFKAIFHFVSGDTVVFNNLTDDDITETNSGWLIEYTKWDEHHKNWIQGANVNYLEIVE